MSRENKENGCNINFNEEENNNLWWLYCLKKKKISEFSEDDMLNINNVMAWWYKEWVQKIDLIEKKILLTWWFDMNNEVMTMVIVSIISYYLNNNFYDRVNEFLKDLRLIKLDLLVNIVNTLINKYKNSDKYCFIANHCQWILFYSEMSQKKELIDNWWIEAIEINVQLKLKNVINELPNLENKVWDPYWFNYFNTLVSYTNYELVFLNKNDNLLKEYINILLNFVLSADININLYSNVLKTVYVNNLSVLYKLSWNKVIEQKINDIENTYLNKEKNGLKTFSKFYGWLDIDWWNNNISYVWLILEEDKISKYSLSYVLSEYSPVITIKNFTKIFHSYYKQLCKEELFESEENIYLKINSLQDVMFYDLMDRLNHIVWFNYELVDYFIKVILIQYLWLNVNEVNISYKFELNDKLNKNIKLIWFNKKNDMNYQSNIVLNFVYNWKQIPLSINLNWDINEKDIKNKFNLYKTKFEVFFKLTLDKLWSLSNFLNVIDDRIWIIAKKHSETVQHMQRVWKLLYDIYDWIEDKKNKKQIDILKDSISIKDKSFFTVLWYLHDIWKYNNLEIMWNYSSINMRTDSYILFIQLLMSLVNDWNVDWNDKITDWNDKEKITINDKEIIEEIKEYNIIITMIDDIFMKIKSFNILFLLWNKIFITNILSIAIDIASIIKNKWYSVNIINDTYKDMVSSNVKEFLGDSICYEGNIDDLFLWIIILFEIFNRKLLEEITHPHIEYWLQFFRFFPEFSYLSSVLYHHKDYPSMDTINKYDGFTWLDNFSSLIWENKKNNSCKIWWSHIELDDKDFIMVMTTAADLVDALLWNRKYQASIDFMKTNSGKYFSSWFINYLNWVFSWEDLTDKEEIFDKVLMILWKEFKNNPNYPEIERVLKKKREEIISMYSSKD